MKDKAATGPTSYPAEKVVDDKTSDKSSGKDEEYNASNPGQAGYFKQKESREKAAKIFLWVISIAIPIIITIFGFAVLNVWQPLITIQQDVKNLDEKVQQNSLDIRDIIKGNYRLEDQIPTPTLIITQ